jgi:hypothetical protein
MKTRPVFESFESFVYSIRQAINEASAPEKGGNVDFLNNKLGGLRMSKPDQSELGIIVAFLNKMMVKGSSSQIEENAETIADFYIGKESGILSTPLKVNKVSNTIDYPYLIAGTVRVKGLPAFYDDDSANIQSRYDEVQTLPLSDVLRLLFDYNLGVWADMVKNGENNEKVFRGSNGGKKGDGDYKYPFLTIDPSGDKTEILQVVPYEGEYEGKYNTKELTQSFASKAGIAPFYKPKYYTKTEEHQFEYGIKFPVFMPEKIDVELGAKLGINYFEDVVYPPAGNSKPEEVVDKPFSTSGSQFFEENSVKISEAGLADIKAMLSEFNSISSIKVNGGASSKPTSRSGGNQGLANDRMNSGIAELNRLKKEGVDQLKGANIQAGTAKVQDASEESDPKNQQVSFVITGYVKSASPVAADPAPIIIKKTADRKADKVKIREYVFLMAWDVKK